MHGAATRLGGAGNCYCAIHPGLLLGVVSLHETAGSPDSAVWEVLPALRRSADALFRKQPWAPFPHGRVMARMSLKLISGEATLTLPEAPAAQIFLSGFRIKMLQFCLFTRISSNLTQENFPGLVTLVTKAHQIQTRGPHQLNTRLGELFPAQILAPLPPSVPARTPDSLSFCPPTSDTQHVSAEKLPTAARTGSVTPQGCPERELGAGPTQSTPTAAGPSQTCLSESAQQMLQCLY
ncbi:hypothetical protein MG293_006034 [Ovis ammon polii]|uniref:Uncharacterized protein n=1 Tax=Ovis ammon polii TaxID=230172 RepID=A0AAD4UFR7_OVIAM|nr:hypothetical protein MG293_006034 [Ovis ammon polii]